MKYGKHLALLGLLSLAQVARAESVPFEIHGTARVRSEFKNNSDFNDGASDYSDFIGSKFQLNMTFTPNEKVKVFFQPQFSKTWGKAEYVPTSTTTNTETSTSGGTYDTGLDVHQAHLGYLVNDELSVIVGRKELNFGDQLLVGGLGWSNVGRSFDLMLANYKYFIGSVDLFTAKVKDNNSATAGPGDKEFTGLYSANKISDELQNLDVYLLYSKDGAPSPATSTTAYGFRAKSPIALFDYRVEVTGEQIVAANVTNEVQADGEVGYLLNTDYATRLSVEYFYASKDFDQLYPTGHKWLGYADLFSRRNIKGYRVGLSSKVVENLKASLDYHKFQRAHNGAAAYKLAGTAYGASGSDDDIGSEYDLVLTYTLEKDLTLEGGASHVMPESYLKANSGEHQATFYYLQVATSF